MPADAAASPFGAVKDESIRSDPPEKIWLVSSLAVDLRGPDGIAFAEKSGDVYVAEEATASIVRIRPDGTRQIVFDRNTALTEDGDAPREPVPGLRSPEGLALDGNGILYVVEDLPGGRLISFDTANPAAGGRVVPIPIKNSRFAWESVDVGPAGELLIAGSTVEDVQRDPEGGGAFKGAILYRDAAGEWWLPLHQVMVSYSAVCFSSDGTYAFFASEFPGDVGCLDLRTQIVRTSYVEELFQAPEGLCALPDGTALVAEESGKIHRVDPVAGTIQWLYDHGNTIESIYWDDARRRLLVTDDQRGRLLSLDTGLEFRSAPQTHRRIFFEEQSAPVALIPEQCPPDLARILKLGGYDLESKTQAHAFRDFARKYSLIAVDAEARLISPDPPVEDPIRRIQFLVVGTGMLGVHQGEVIGPASGFVAIQESGQMVKTELVQRRFIQGDLWEGAFALLGEQNLAVPQPFGGRMAANGVASLYFMGLGMTPDYHLELNSVNPEESFMLVMQPDESLQQYELRPSPNPDRGQWVIALERSAPETWRRLAFPD